MLSENGRPSTWYARHYYRERQREEWELENYAQGERAEMVGLWCYKGLTKPDAERCIDLLASYKKFFVDLMMTEELRMFAPPGRMRGIGELQGRCWSRWGACCPCCSGACWILYMAPCWLARGRRARTS